MENIEIRLAEIIEKSPLPVQMKAYYKSRLEKGGASLVFVESLKSMLRAVEIDAFGRMGLSVDEDDDPEIKRAVKMYSAAVEDAVKKYGIAVKEAGDKIADISTKAGRNIEKLGKDALKASIG